MQDADLLNYEQVRGEMVCHNSLIISTLKAVLLARHFLLLLLVESVLNKGSPDVENSKSHLMHDLCGGLMCMPRSNIAATQRISTC